jgi:hypothetical protein
MAERLPNPSERFRIDRRTLLKSYAAITAAKFAPDVPLSEIEPVVSAQTVPAPSPALLNASAATARLLDIRRRNNLRHDAGLPLLDVSKEWRRLKARQAAQDYANFAERFRRRMQTKVLARIRRQVGDGQWKPEGTFQGMAVQNEVSKRLAKLYERVGHG